MVPVLVGAALALESGDVLWELLPVVLLCSFLFQAGTNAINDYFDFVRGVDKDDSHCGSSGVLAKGLPRPGEVFVFLSLPLTLRNLRDIWSSGEESVCELTYLVVRTVQLHLVFGALLSVGIALGTLISS